MRHIQHQRINIMSTTSKLKFKLQSFFVKLSSKCINIARDIKHQIIPMQEHEIEYTFTDPMRHCPSNELELEQVRSNVELVFSDISHTELYKSLMLNVPWANQPQCKPWSENECPLPKTMDSPFSSVIVRSADRMSTTYWVLWFNDKVEVVHPHQNRGEYRTGNQVVMVNDVADNMPDNVIAAAQVTLGVTQTKDNTLCGFQWKLYR